MNSWKLFRKPAIATLMISPLKNSKHGDPLEPDDDRLFELPKWTDPIEYQAPAKTSFMTQNPFFTQLGNSVSSCNIHGCTTLLTIMEEVLLPLVENVILEYNLPTPNTVSSLQLTCKDLTTLVWLPWDHVVRTSYFMALDYFRITPVWDIPAIEALLNNLLPAQDQTYLQQFTDNLVEILHHPTLY